VAWRGNKSPENPTTLIDRIRGATADRCTDVAN
jgi:hypothetical protein